MTDIAAWIAPIATTLAAIMTAANLGTRVTGWGFVVFTVGSVGWSAYALGTGQSGLLWQNLFLTVVNGIGIWRWLGRQASLDKGARAATLASAAAPDPTLFPASSLTSGTVEGRGAALGTAVDAMVRCRDGGIAYVVVSQGGLGGVGETLRALPWEHVTLTADGLRADLSPEQAEVLQAVERTAWPSKPPAPVNQDDSKFR
jgi:hypothetical protein